MVALAMLLCPTRLGIFLVALSKRSVGRRRLLNQNILGCFANVLLGRFNQCRIVVIAAWTVSNKVSELPASRTRSRKTQSVSHREYWRNAVNRKIAGTKVDQAADTPWLYQTVYTSAVKPEWNHQPQSPDS